MSIFDTAEFLSDALDDLTDFYAVKAPVVASVPAGFVPALVHLCVVQLTDVGFLHAVDTALALYKLSDTLAPVYVATPDTARGARRMGYVEGVRKPSRKKPTRDEQAAIEARKWGLVAS